MHLTQQLFDEVVKRLETARDQTGQILNMDSIIVSQGDDYFRHSFNERYGLGQGMNDLRSISKPFVAMAIGIGIERGVKLWGERLSLDMKIWPFFRGRVEVDNKRNLPKLEHVTLRHLLTHTIGYDVGLLFSKDIEHIDKNMLLEYLFNYDILHEPGTHFEYSNAGPYIFSALLQECLGVKLSDWVNQLVFQPLGITHYEWKDYGKYCAASTGLRLANEDVHKAGRLLLDGGRYGDTQVVPRFWTESMHAAQVETPTFYDAKRVFPKFAYGYCLWICKDGRYYCDGTEGQYLIVLPSSGTVITTFGHQADMKPITECMVELL